MVSVVYPDGSVSTGSPLHSTRLRSGPRRVRTPVLPVGDPEVCIIGLNLDAIDSLDRIRDVSVVDERTVPGEGVINRQLLPRC